MPEDIPSPTADFCWEGRMACVIVLLLTLYFITYLRWKALRGTQYSIFTPRGAACGSVLAVVSSCTAYAVLTVWNYTRWYDVRGYYQLSKAAQDDALVSTVWDMVPENREAVSFAMRMILVTVLWLVKFSFLIIYYEFPQSLPRSTRILLHTTTFAVVASYIGIWIVNGIEWTDALGREALSPNAGATITLFFPLNSWSTYVPRGNWERTADFPGIFTAELVTTTLNVFTHIMLVVLVVIIFQHLNLSRSDRTQFRAASLLFTLFSIALIIALARFVVLCVSMQGIYARLAFDTLTDFEAFLGGCAASIPALRVLMRGGRACGVAEVSASQRSPNATNTSFTKKPLGSPPVSEKCSWFPSWKKNGEKEACKWADEQHPTSFESERDAGTAGQVWGQKMAVNQTDLARAGNVPGHVGKVEVTISSGGYPNRW